jgi:hypothetical protein
MLLPNAASAFTYEDGASNLLTPQFDIEEQARKFNTPNIASETATGDKRGVETPIGTLHFGVRRDTPVFGSPFSSSFNSRAREDQRHFERMLTPVPKPEDIR